MSLSNFVLVFCKFLILFDEKFEWKKQKDWFEIFVATFGMTVILKKILCI